MIAQNYRHKILKLYYCKSLNTIELPPFKIKKTQHKKEKKPTKMFLKNCVCYMYTSACRVKEK